jgi:hypothetical protein
MAGTPEGGRGGSGGRPAGLARAALLAAALLAIQPDARAADAFDPARSDPRAIAVADLVIQALGGQKAWDSTHYIRFAFVVEKDGKEVARRAHLWDRFSGRLRFENTDKQGRSYVVLMNVGTREGAAYRGGAPVAEAESKPLVEGAYEAWVNDTYWLLMPYKMKDPGVRLAYAGEVRENGQVYDRILLSFDHVGLTPGDRYWAHVNRATHIMDRWEYILQDDPPAGPPTIWDWKNWTRYGSILLSPEKVMRRDGAAVRILHPGLEVPDSVPDAAFTSPAPPHGGPSAGAR